MFLGSLAQMMIATEMCGVGDVEPLKRIVSAVDRRFRFCVARDPAWSKLLGDFTDAEKRSLSEGSSRSLGSFFTESFLRTRGAEARAKGNSAYCAAIPWRMLLEPATATEEAKAEYMRTNPKATLDNALAFFGYIRNLGIDQAWVEASCDKEFWPEFPVTKK